jgi:hypothetical protein
LRTYSPTFNGDTTVKGATAQIGNAVKSDYSGLEVGAKLIGYMHESLPTINDWMNTVGGQGVGLDDPTGQIPGIGSYFPWSLDLGVAVVDATVCYMDQFVTILTDGTTVAGTFEPQAWGKTVAVVPLRLSQISEAQTNIGWTLAHMEFPYRQMSWTGHVFDGGVSVVNTPVVPHANRVHIEGPQFHILYVIVDQNSGGTVDHMVDINVTHVGSITNNVITGVPLNITAALDVGHSYMLEDFAISKKAFDRWYNWLATGKDIASLDFINMFMAGSNLTKPFKSNAPQQSFSPVGTTSPYDPAWSTRTLTADMAIALNRSYTDINMTRGVRAVLHRQRFHNVMSIQRTDAIQEVFIMKKGVVIPDRPPIYDDAPTIGSIVVSGMTMGGCYSAISDYVHQLKSVPESVILSPNQAYLQNGTGYQYVIGARESEKKLIMKATGQLVLNKTANVNTDVDQVALMGTVDLITTYVPAARVSAKMLEVIGNDNIPMELAMKFDYKDVQLTNQYIIATTGATANFKPVYGPLINNWLGSEKKQAQIRMALSNVDDTAPFREYVFVNLGGMTSTTPIPVRYLCKSRAVYWYLGYVNWKNEQLYQINAPLHTLPLYSVRDGRGLTTGFSIHLSARAAFNERGSLQPEAGVVFTPIGHNDEVADVDNRNFAPPELDF